MILLVLISKSNLGSGVYSVKWSNHNWKKGFYYIAQGAGLPIILVAIDYAKKCITAEKVIHPSGDLDKDMREIKLYYKNFKGKYPENFSIGKVE